jgi:magnesium-transporting ATPase (P-type)
MEAHIGIGIYGEEGLRAAQSSDYAIGEFQVLRRLLFVHGYLNLMRNSIMVIYFFYKNFVFTIIHFFYGFLCDFSGQTIIEDWFVSSFNLFFTSIPLAARGILDISLRPDDGVIVEILMPYLYKEQREKPIFNIKNYLFNLLKGIIHALINYFVTIYVVYKEIDDNGHDSNLWLISAVLYTNILMIVTIDLVIFTKYHTYINLIIILTLTYLLYVLFLIIVEKVNVFTSTGTINVTFNSTLVWMNIILVSGICGLIDFIILAYNQLFVNNIYHHIRGLTNKNDISYKYIETIPIELKELLLENDKVKEFNEKNINIDNGSNKYLNDININNNIENVQKLNEKSEINNDNINVLNDGNNIKIYVSNKCNNILQTTKKVVKKK